ncbi:unnamed protein product [Cochlearia groenlandica]
MTNKNNIIIVFDFDKTIIDVDSDNWVVDELGFTDLFEKLLPTMPWNSLMNRMMKELHEHGKTIDEIKQVLRTVPIHPRVISAIKSAHALGCELRIVSDANTLFIETIVEHLGISELFSEINTNPGFVNEHGRLIVSPYTSSSSHGCSLCPPNMCKGLIIERIQDSLTKEGINNNKTIIYVGDGAGDYCPSLKLKTEDYMMPRKNFPVWDLINQNQKLVKATVKDWTDGESMEKILMGIINEINMSLQEEEEVENILSSDNCKIGIVHEPVLPLQVTLNQLVK